MGVLIEAVNVVIRNETVESRLAGGMQEYKRRCPNRTFCMDSHVCRVGFMTTADAAFYIENLVSLGFRPPTPEGSPEVALISQDKGFDYPCGWLELGRVPLGDGRSVEVAWLRGTGFSELMAPPQWTPGKIHPVRPEELEFLESKGSVNIFRNKATGELAYVGRTDEHDVFYSRALELVQFTTTMVAPAQVSGFKRGKVRRGIRLLDRVMELNPENWNALWVMGKAYQALGDSSKALASFTMSHSINPNSPDIAREASISAIESSQNDVAIAFAERAVQLDPDDPGLRSNLALMYLFGQQLQLAEAQIEQAYAKDPFDKITLNVRKLIKDVLNGRRSCPRNRREM